MNIRLFIKPYCGWCGRAMDWLDDHGVQYEKAYDEMYRLSGQTLAPVIEVDGKVLADFGPQELAAWWRKNGFAGGKP
jgi:glutaredoxin 3